MMKVMCIDPKKVNIPFVMNNKAKCTDSQAWIDQSIFNGINTSVNIKMSVIKMSCKSSRSTLLLDIMPYAWASRGHQWVYRLLQERTLPSLKHKSFCYIASNQQSIPIWSHQANFHFNSLVHLHHMKTTVNWQNIILHC